MKPLFDTTKRAVLVLAVVAVFGAVAAACPNCKENLADPQNASIARGYFYSILFMMSMPFAILGAFGSLAYFSIRCARAQQARDVGSAQDGPAK